VAVYFDDFDTNKKIIDTLIENGVFTDWFLFCSEALRICPPLNITYNEIEKACEIIIDVLDNKV
jgi:acetylornithine/N-succinyldiaminopimelate aminotransferase